MIGRNISIAMTLTLMVMLMLATAVRSEDKLPALDRAAAEKISFRRDVWPIMKRHCRGCHSGAMAKGGLSVDTVAEMLKGGDTGPLFEKGKPDDSPLIQMTVGAEPEMPKKQPPLSAAKIHVLRLWVLAGAKDDSTPGDLAREVVIPETYRFAPAVTSVALSGDGNLLAAACRSEVVLIDLRGDQPLRRLATDCDLLSHVEFSPDGKLLAAVGGSPANYGSVRYFNPTDGKVVGSRRVGHDTLFRGAFAPDGKAVAVGGADGAVHVIPIDAKSAVRSFDLHSDWVFDVAYTPDGKKLVSGGRDKATKVCSVETGKLLRTIDTSTELISSVAADGAFAVGAGKARLPISYELKIALAGVTVTGAGNGARPVSRRNQYAKNLEALPGEVFDIATSGDRKLLAVAGAHGDVRVYQLADRKRVSLIANVPAPVYSVALNSNGTRLALGSKSGQVQVYELPSGKLLKSLTPVPVAAIAASAGKK